MDARARSLRGRIGGHSLHAKRDMRPHLNRARARFLERFEREVDPEGVLSDAERVRRAAHAKKVYFMRLALKSAQARARRSRGHKRVHARTGAQSALNPEADRHSVRES